MFTWSSFCLHGCIHPGHHRSTQLHCSPDTLQSLIAIFQLRMSYLKPTLKSLLSRRCLYQWGASLWKCGMWENENVFWITAEMNTPCHLANAVFLDPASIRNLGADPVIGPLLMAKGIFSVVDSEVIQYPDSWPLWTMFITNSLDNLLVMVGHIAVHHLVCVHLHQVKHGQGPGASQNIE